MKVTDLDPQEVFYYFSEISRIPHGSGNTAALAGYCLDFAKKRGLKAHRDGGGNVIIYKEGTPGYEESPPVILQGHLDMVCEKKPGLEKDMEKEAITLCCDGDYVWAEGTTLGGDDGIAVAYILALLDSEDLPHPPLEALLTRDEESGMLGAQHLEAAALRGKRLINIDSEEEGILTVSSAGGVTAHCEIPLHFEICTGEYQAFRIFLDGLKGGHSGTDINAHRQNAHVLMGRVLQGMAQTLQFNLAYLGGGMQDNAIPQTAEAVICTRSEDFSRIAKAVEQLEAQLKEEFARTEPTLRIRAEACPLPDRFLCAVDTKKLIFTLQHVPNGILAMDPDIPGLVQTSLNMGIMIIEEHALILVCLLRSNCARGKQYAMEKLASFIAYIGGTVAFTGGYPVWEYRADSPLREIMIAAYRELYGKEPQIAAIHAGLECSILSAKLPEADMVSFGPDLENVHTPGERMNVASVGRCWRYLLKVLAMCKK